MRNILIIFLLVISINLYSQSEALSARALSLGFVGQTDTTVFSAFYNQGQLAKLKGFRAGIFYQNFLSLPGYDLKDIALAYGFKNTGTVALDFSSVGIPGYNEQKLGLAYGMQLFSNFYAGLQLNLNIIDQPSYYGNIYTATAEVSAIYTPIQKLNIAFHAFNLWYGFIKSDNLPLILGLALDYKFSPKAYFTAEVEKNILQPAAFKWGAEYRVIDALGVRIGGRYQGNIYTYTMGMAYWYENFAVELGFANHPLTGFTGGINLLYHLD